MWWGVRVPDRLVLLESLALGQDLPCSEYRLHLRLKRFVIHITDSHVRVKWNLTYALLV